MTGIVRELSYFFRVIFDNESSAQCRRVFLISNLKFIWIVVLGSLNYFEEVLVNS
jgi:hypothetical protein